MIQIQIVITETPPVKMKPRPSDSIAMKLECNRLAREDVTPTETFIADMFEELNKQMALGLDPSMKIQNIKKPKQKKHKKH